MTEVLEPADGDEASAQTDIAATNQRAIAQAKGIAALSVLAGMRQCAAALEAIRASDDPLVQSVLFSGLVVNYVRAFEEVRDAGGQTTRSFSVRKLPAPFNKVLHDTLLSLRNDQVAHLGHVLNDFSLTFMTATMRIETLQPDGTTAQEVTRHLIGTRARASLACGIATIDTHESLLAHIRALETEASQRLALAIIEHDVVSIPRLAQVTKDGAGLATLKTKKFAMNGPGLLTVGEEDLAISLAKAPIALPLTFAVMHCHLVEENGAITLEGFIVTE